MDRKPSIDAAAAAAKAVKGAIKSPESPQSPFSTQISAEQIPIDDTLESVLASVVKVFCISTPVNYHMPWQKKSQVDCTASGFIIKDRLILSNAHATTDATQIRLRKHGESTKYLARIVHIGHECDLVLLTVDDEEFWTTKTILKPLKFSKQIPTLQETLIIVGYPTGGDNLSVTKGVVSRVSMQQYTHGWGTFLAIQTDSAINPGNSGGPALQGKSVIGVAFQNYSGLQSVGYIIPIPVIEHFLEDIKRNGHYTGFPTMLCEFQVMEHKALRDYLKIPKDQHGVHITDIDPASSLIGGEGGGLQVNDVITAIDDVSIQDDGTIEWRKAERLTANYLTSNKFIGDEVTFTLIRDGKELRVNCTLNDGHTTLMPFHLHDQQPEYLIYGGIVFTTLSLPYLNEFNEYQPSVAIPIHLHNMYSFHNRLEFIGQQIVIISRILVDNVNMGLDSSDYINSFVFHVNDIKIQNLKHLANEIDKVKDKNNQYIKFGLKFKKFIVISTDEARNTEQRILKQNSIALSRSENLIV